MIKNDVGRINLDSDKLLNLFWLTSTLWLELESETKILPKNINKNKLEVDNPKVVLSKSKSNNNRIKYNKDNITLIIATFVNVAINRLFFAISDFGNTIAVSNFKVKIILKITSTERYVAW